LIALESADDEELAVRRLSNSPYLSAIVDSILEDLDRQTLTELLAYYLYRSSNSRVDFLYDFSLVGFGCCYL
jgi:hypothetical protein